MSDLRTLFDSVASAGTAARDFVTGLSSQLESAEFAGRVIEQLGASSEWNILSGEPAFREVLGRHSPAQVLDAIAAAEPTAAPFINIIKTNPELAATFHTQVTTDPNFLTRMVSLTPGEGSGIDLAELAAKPYGARLLQEIQTPLSQLMTDENYTLAQLQTDARSGVFRAITGHAAGLDPSERLTFMRTELSALDPNVGGLFESLSSAPEAVQTAVGNAITHNPAFSEYLVQRFGTDTGGANLTNIFSNMDEARAGAVADIMNTIANGTGYQTVEDFEKLDRVLAATDERARLEQERLRLLEANPNADMTTITEQIAAADRELLLSAQAAGADIPAFALLDQQSLGQFFRDLFDPNSPDPARSALNNLAQTLQLSGADLEAFNQLMGPLAQIMNFMFEPYAQLFQNHGATMGNGLSGIMTNVGNLANRTPVQFEAPVAVGNTTGAAATMTSDAFNEAWDNATAKTFDDVRTELLEADPLLVEELRAISEDPTLRARFEHAVTTTATPEELEAAARAFQAQIAGGATLNTAISAMTPGSP